ncbi:MAG: ATP-grasp domain-containing protein [Gammaproteobacteria bacterium]
MRIVSFDAFRSLGIPGVRYIKPELYQQNLETVKQADWLLFPAYWQVNALYYGLNAKIFPSIASYHIGHDKIEQTRVFQLLWPGNTPETLILANTPENREKTVRHFGGPFVAKAPKSSEGHGVFLIETEEQWLDYCARTPILYVQEWLPIDRDMRIVVVGKNIIGGYWRLQGADGFHNNLAQGGLLEIAPLPQAAVELVLQIALALNIDHGGFDVAMVGETPFLLEFNRLFGNHGLIEQGINPRESIYRHLSSLFRPDFTPPQQREAV